MNRITEREFLQARKPSRYIGGEYNQKKKKWSPDIVTFALAFPDIYEIGMSHLGSQILYYILNDSPYTLCERVFAPWIDFEKILRSRDIPLFSLESRMPIKEFDILGFSLGYELNYTNILNILGLSGIKIFSNERADGPLVIAGGIGAFSPEPIAPFIDLFVIGDGEEAIIEIVEEFRTFKSGKPLSRYEKLLGLSQLSGVYVPLFYKDTYTKNGALKGIEPLRRDIPSRIKKRVVKDIDTSPYPVDMLVPFADVVHDRYVLEIMRGCTRGCRFCQAGFLYRPLRERSVKRLLELAGEGIKRTGYEEISLVSLSSGDYSSFSELINSLNIPMTSVSVSSLHIENITPEISSFLRGITFAPETGDKKVNCAINKKFNYEKFLEVVEYIFKKGHRKIKLYFMLGLPGEKESSLADLLNLVSEIERRRQSRSQIINLSVSSFIPKPHTPFQWEKMEDLEVLRERQMKIKKSLEKIKCIKFDCHDLSSSFLEAVFSRGDRRLSAVIYEAWKKGAVFDSWRECFKYSVWDEAFKKMNIDPYFYSHRERADDEVLPWDHIDTGIDKSFFILERDRARQGVESPDCRRECPECGLCANAGVKNILTSISM